MWSNVVMEQQQQQQKDAAAVEGSGRDVLSNIENNDDTKKDKSVVLEPGGRYKHAIALASDDLYLYGGKSGYATLKDLWKLQLRGGFWSKIEPKDNNSLPPPLQEHSLVHFNGNLYLFGGQIGLTDPKVVPLWIYNIKNNEWRKLETNKGAKAVPAGGRRGHVATVYSNYMLLHGGYRDLMGSLGDLWAFHFETESWHLFHCHSTPHWYSSNSNCGPSPRHNHGSIENAGSFYVIGGMCNLEEKNDLWKYNLNSRRWTQIKSKPQPGPLKSPSVSKALGSMFVLGGERNGKEVDELWKFTFDTEVWERITIHGPTKPTPRQSPAVVMLPALIKIKNVSESTMCKNGKNNDDDDEGSSSPNNYWWDYGPKTNTSSPDSNNDLITSNAIVIDPGVTNHQIIAKSHNLNGITGYENEYSEIKEFTQSRRPRRSESAHCVVNGQQSILLNDKCRVKKSSSVRFHDQSTILGSNRLPTSDYSSMETIVEQRIGNSFENPNYGGSHFTNPNDNSRRGGRGNRVSPREGLIGELIEMDEFGEDQQLLLSQQVHQQQQQYEITTPNYLLMIGGLESGFSNSQLFGKKPLSIWRLRVSPELFNN